MIFYPRVQNYYIPTYDTTRCENMCLYYALYARTYGRYNMRMMVYAHTLPSIGT